jgi:hypothetical protein
MSDAQSIIADPEVAQGPAGWQALTFFVPAYQDDATILSSTAGDWLQALRKLDWRSLRSVAAEYYQALWNFNKAAAQERRVPEVNRLPNLETSEEAGARLVAQRPTGGNTSAPLLRPESPAVALGPSIHPERLEPGIVPFRLGGKTPKCFFALAKAFLGLHLMGKAASAEEVAHHLQSNSTVIRRLALFVAHLAMVPGACKSRAIRQSVSANTSTGLMLRTE